MLVKILLILLAVIILLAGVMLIITLATNGWRFPRCEAVSYDVTDSFESLLVVSRVADIEILPSEDGRCRVVCYEQPKMSSTVSVVDGVLQVEQVDTRRWYEHLSFDLWDAKVTLYLPSAVYQSLTVRASTGDISVEKITVGTVAITLSTGDVCLADIDAADGVAVTSSTGDISIARVKTNDITVIANTGDIALSDVVCAGEIATENTTGDVELYAVKAKSLVSQANTGEAEFSDVAVAGTLAIKRTTGETVLADTVADKFLIEASTGDVTFMRSDAAEIFVTTDTGDVTGSLLSSKVYIVRTDTGKIDVPKTTLGGRCEITTDTGDIKITVEEK